MSRIATSRHTVLTGWLHDFLCSLNADEPLPRPAEIARIFRRSTGGAGDAYLVCGALLSLDQRGFIALRHGTRTEHRGHQAVRIIATGAVLKTEGCPFEPPPLRTPPTMDRQGESSVGAARAST